MRQWPRLFSYLAFCSPRLGDGRIGERCGARIGFDRDAGEAKHLRQLLRRDLERPWPWADAGCRLWIGGGAGGVEGDVAFDLTHDLMNVAVQNGHRAKALQQCDRLCAVASAPAPRLVHIPERDVA